MEEVISAAEANRRFSNVLRGVRSGRSYVVTSHGTPVARIVPVTDESLNAAREAAKRVLLERLAAQPALGLPRWSRDELYDE
ncbi:MAG TPA: type II toxin-antitoxin system prevent-host-death family antitoxin [Stellaceae bacterium]|nr:type II toxin-antitoxin system prevent-host-death family antitoxin [Stellaceae bacterium]